MITSQKPATRLLWLMGATMTVPFLLACGPLAGYVVGKFFLVDQLQWPPFTILVCVFMGFLGSAIQVFRLIRRMSRISLGER